MGKSGFDFGRHLLTWTSCLLCDLMIFLPLFVCSCLGVILWPRLRLGEEDGRPQCHGRYVWRDEAGKAASDMEQLDTSGFVVMCCNDSSVSRRTWARASVRSPASTASAWRMLRCSRSQTRAPLKPWRRALPALTAIWGMSSSGKVPRK